MYHALEIQEILLNIFYHCPRSDLPALARTCRTFKEPALDVLWGELNNLSPLAQCLPEASRRLSSENDCYSFHRLLTQVEWDILHSYTRHIRSISMGESPCGLDPQSITSLSRPLTSEPLFLNLRSLSFEYTDENSAMFLLPLPSLLSLYIHLYDPQIFDDSLKSFAQMSPNLRTLSIHESSRAINLDTSEVDPSFICQWRNLQIVACLDIFLDVNTLVHLSCIPALTQLSFALSSALPHQIAPSDLPLIFSHLHTFSLRSESLTTVSKLLLHRLPAITRLRVFIQSRPSKQDVSSFLYSVQTTGIADTIQQLFLIQMFALDRAYLPDFVDPKPVLGFKDLDSSMAFSNLREINFDVEWKVSLTDAELLILASAWPRLETFFVNRGWGWGTRGGITPDGLLRFLGACPLLTRVALAIDTRGYTHLAPTLGASFGLDPCRRLSSIDVLDSCIEADAVSAIAAFLVGIIVPRFDVPLRAWASRVMIMKFWNRVEHKDRWDDVCRRIKDSVDQRS